MMKLRNVALLDARADLLRQKCLRKLSLFLPCTCGDVGLTTALSKTSRPRPAPLST